MHRSGWMLPSAVCASETVHSGSPARTLLWQGTHWRPTPLQWSQSQVGRHSPSFASATYSPSTAFPPPPPPQGRAAAASATHCRTQQCILHLVEGSRHRKISNSLVWLYTENLRLVEGEQLPQRRATGETWKAIEAPIKGHCQPTVSAI